MEEINFSIPKTGAESQQISLKLGEVLYILGANGVGKSALMQRIYSQNKDESRRITAHRQNWFRKNASNLTSAARTDTETNIKSWDGNPEARYLDEYSDQRTNMSLYDLISEENKDARAIAKEVRAANEVLVEKLSKKDAPITGINKLLRLSNLQIEISIGDGDTILASKAGSPTYSISALSDGERNALLLAADILTVKPGTVVLVDEPERHLHRAIISPLLLNLFAKRADCFFVVSTHEINLPIDNPDAKVLLVRDCTYQNQNIESWNFDLVDAGKIDDEIKRDILGSRRKLLFIEGGENSLDKPLYSLIFPNISIIPKASCEQVRRAVGGIRQETSVNWVHAFGLVDNDRRPEREIMTMEKNGVYSLSVFSVESIYYHPEIQQKVLTVRLKEIAIQQGASIKSTCDGFLDQAKQAALKSIEPHIERLSRRVAEKKIREQFELGYPNKRTIESGEPINFNIDVAKYIQDERNYLQVLFDAGDLTKIIENYPIRETSALDDIAKCLQFDNRKAYEQAVRELVISDPKAVEFIQSLFGDLYLTMQE